MGTDTDHSDPELPCNGGGRGKGVRAEAADGDRVLAFPWRVLLHARPEDDKAMMLDAAGGIVKQVVPVQIRDTASGFPCYDGAGGGVPQARRVGTGIDVGLAAGNRAEFERTSARQLLLDSMFGDVRLGFVRGM